MVNKTLFSSATGEWETPQDLFDELNEEFKFTRDLAAKPQNAKCNCYIMNNSLDEDWSAWSGYQWLNPPYGRQVGKWVEKAHKERLRGAKIVMLLPARTDTKWFHDYIYRKYKVRFIRGRLKFAGSKNPAPFPSMLVIFN